jgi:hypothetical protein
LAGLELEPSCGGFRLLLLGGFHEALIFMLENHAELSSRAIPLLADDKFSLSAQTLVLPVVLFGPMDEKNYIRVLFE